MNEQPTLPRAQWSSLTNYLLVTTGAVVGLGNIIHFPYYVYKFGGSFVLLYIACELFISLPILFAELLLGRRGKQNPVGAISVLTIETGASRRWRWIGWLCFVNLFLSLASYAVSAAFSEGYFSNILSHIATHGVSAQPTHLSYSAVSSDFFNLEICFLIFLFATFFVIQRGINRGLETISRITVPLCFILLFGLAIYSCWVGNAAQAVAYLIDITPNASFGTVLFAALTYAFFKLNVGMGSMIVYGTYLPYSVPIARSAFLVVCFDAIISLLAYFVIYPLFTPTHQELTAAHTYQGLLYLFSQAPHGNIVALLFFLVAVIAAWTPTIAMAESATVILLERFHLSRTVATYIIFCGAALIGTAIVLSYHRLSQVLLFHTWNIAAFVNKLTANIFIPIAAFLIAIFTGWIVTRDITYHELGFKPAFFALWRFLIRFIAPLSIILISLMLIKTST